MAGAGARDEQHTTQLRHLQKASHADLPTLPIELKDSDTERWIESPRRAIRFDGILSGPSRTVQHHMELLGAKGIGSSVEFDFLIKTE